MTDVYLNDALPRPSPAPTAARSRRTRLLVTTVSLAGSGATTLLFNVAAAKQLGPHGFGELARSFAVGLVIAQLTMGSIAPAVAWWAAGLEDEQRAAAAMRGMRILAIGTALAAALCIPVALIGVAPTPTPLWASMFCFTLVYPLYFGLKLLLFVLGRIKLYAALELSSDVFFVGVLLFLLREAPRWSAMAFSIAYTPFIFIALMRIRSSAVRGEQPRPRMRKLVPYGGLTLAGTYASSARYPAVIVASALVGSSVISGRVSAMLALLSPLFLLPQAAGVLTFAEIARDRGRDAYGTTRAHIRTVALISAFVSLVSVPTARPVVTHFLGARYETLVGPLVLIFIAVVPLLAATPAGNALAGAGKAGLSAAISNVGLVSACGITLLLVPRFGVTGAAVGVSTAAVLQGALALIAARRWYGLRLSDLRLGATILAIAACATQLATLWASVTVLAVAGLLAARYVRPHFPVAADRVTKGA